MKKLILIALLLPLIGMAQISEMPFKGANQIIISDTNLQAFGQHLVNNGFDIENYWPEFNVFSTSYKRTSKMNLKYKIRAVKNDTSIYCNIVFLLAPRDVPNLNTVPGSDWEYKEGKSTYYNVIYRDLMSDFLPYGKKIFFYKKPE